MFVCTGALLLLINDAGVFRAPFCHYDSQLDQIAANLFSVIRVKSIFEVYTSVTGIYNTFIHFAKHLKVHK